MMQCEVVLGRCSVGMIILHDFFGFVWRAVCSDNSLMMILIRRHLRELCVIGSGPLTLLMTSTYGVHKGVHKQT